MDINEHIQYWIEGAEHDLDAAEALFQAGKYDWCLFIGHLVLEKAVKAVFVRDNGNKIPPKTHSLVILANLTQLPFTEDQILFPADVKRFPYTNPLSFR